MSFGNDSRVLPSKRISTPTFIFTDPGIDDALALAIAAVSPNLQVIGACGVDGNVPSRSATRNLQSLLQLFGMRNVPVFQSAVDDPVHDYPTHVHGKNGLGDVRIKLSKKYKEKDLGDYLKNFQGKFQILSLGPLTAVADLFAKTPEIVDQVSRCVIMGGGIAGGNVTPYAEFNIYSNPEAADWIFRSNVQKILLPLDVTEKVRLHQEDLETLQMKRGQKARALSGMLQFYFNFQKGSNGIYGGFMHDPTAVLAITNPELFHFRRARVRVDVNGETRGRTVAIYARDGSTQIATKVDEDAARSEIMAKLLQISS